MLKKSTLLFLSVFLLLAFSVSPAEAAKEKGPRCSDGMDNDVPPLHLALLSHRKILLFGWSKSRFWPF